MHGLHGWSVRISMRYQLLKPLLSPCSSPSLMVYAVPITHSAVARRNTTRSFAAPHKFVQRFLQGPQCFFGEKDRDVSESK